MKRISLFILALVGVASIVTSAQAAEYTCPPATHFFTFDERIRDEIPVLWYQKNDGLAPAGATAIIGGGGPIPSEYTFTRIMDIKPYGAGKTAWTCVYTAKPGTETETIPEFKEAKFAYYK